jgi:hypothetical protein
MRERGEVEEQRYCAYCGHRLEPEARFCSNCGRPVHRAADVPTPEEDAPTSQLPTSPPPQHQPREEEARGGIAWHRPAMPRGGIRWPMVALAGVFLILVVVEIVGGMFSEVIPVMVVVAAVVLVASGISYLSLTRRGRATLGEAVFNWSVVVLAAFATLLFLIS